MPRPRRMYIANEVYFGTARIREGLPFVPDELINSVIEGILARAQHLYPIEICGYVFMGNHFHILFICYDPELVQRYFSYLKGELGYAINVLIGKRGPVWQGRTDTPVVVGADAILDQLIYMFTNPQSAGLVDKIEEYPGVNSWLAISEGEEIKQAKWYKTSELEKLPRSIIEQKARKTLIDKLSKKPDRDVHEIKITPFSWTKNLEISVEEAKKQLVNGVRERESQLRRAREGFVVGVKTLKNRSIRQWHRPKKYGRRVLVICRNINFRKQLISSYRDFVEECRSVYERWKIGDFSLFYPPGAFAPPAKCITSALF